MRGPLSARIRISGFEGRSADLRQIAKQ
jgi:hypothetical protein